MTENLNKKPPKGILKSSSSFDTASCGSASGGGNGGRRNSGVAGGCVGGEVVPGVSRQCSNELGVDECCSGDNGVEYVHVRKHSKTAKFDEMNILETYHPATKTYGHMKIEEPKTPFNYYEDDEGEGESSQCVASSSKRRSKEINADELLRKLEEAKGDIADDVAAGRDEEEEEESSCEDEDDESKEARVKFESKRKAHYNEYYAVKLARKLMEEEQEEDDDKDAVVDEDTPGKFIPEEETGVNEERDSGDRMVTE